MQACWRGESWGWVVAAPVLWEHCASQPPAWPSNSHKIRPPPGLEVPEVVEITTANLRFGIGSFGHPHFCTRPCVHISKGGVCPSGTACAYCHFPHRAMSKPDCRLRQRLLDASDQELLATFLPFISSRRQRRKASCRVSTACSSSSTQKGRIPTSTPLT